MSIRDTALACIGWGYTPHGRYNPSQRRQMVDCWGLVLHVLGRHGRQLPDPAYTEDWSAEFSFLESYHNVAAPVDAPLEGDVAIMYGPRGVPNHAGVYIGFGEIVHTSDKAGVVVSRVARMRCKLAGFFRCQ